jgi:acetyl esterase/lipase
MLLAEGKVFAERLKTRGKEVGYRVVPEAKHAWDKPLPFNPPENLGVEYGEAVRVMSKWLGAEDVDTNGHVTDESVPEGVEV